jgi:hypothetical protein
VLISVRSKVRRKSVFFKHYIRFRDGNRYEREKMKKVLAGFVAFFVSMSVSIVFATEEESSLVRET